MSVRIGMGNCVNVPHPMFNYHHHFVNVNTGEERCSLPDDQKHPIESWSALTMAHSVIVGFALSPLPWLIIFVWFAVAVFKR